MAKISAYTQPPLARLQIGFGIFSEKFASQMVDGDLLLLLTEKELDADLHIKSGLLRKRFMRELESLKVSGCGDRLPHTSLFAADRRRLWQR